MKLFFYPVCIFASLQIMAQTAPEVKGMIYKHDFEAEAPDHGKAIRVLNNTPGRIETVASSQQAAAAVPEGANSALIFAGGSGNEHSWQPAADIELPNLKHGYLYIGFMIKNASLDASVFGIQISRNVPDSYRLWQQFHLNPGHITVTGTGRGLGKEELSAGVDAQWVKIEWIIPTPGNTEGVPRLLVNGKDQGEIDAAPLTENLEEINLLRLWMAHRRGEDTLFFVDNLVVASAANLKELAEIARGTGRPTMP